MWGPYRTEREPQQSFYRLLPSPRSPHPPPRRLPHRKRLLHERLYHGTRSLTARQTTNETTNETDCQTTRTTAIPATRQHLPSHLQPASATVPHRNLPRRLQRHTQNRGKLCISNAKPRILPLHLQRHTKNSRKTCVASTNPSILHHHPQRHTENRRKTCIASTKPRNPNRRPQRHTKNSRKTCIANTKPRIPQRHLQRHTQNDRKTCVAGGAFKKLTNFTGRIYIKRTRPCVQQYTVPDHWARFSEHSSARRAKLSS